MSTFSPSGSAQLSLSGGLTPVSTPTVVNLNLAVVGTEYSQTVPAGTKRIFISSRVNQLVRLAYAPGDTNTAWLTIPPGSNYSEVDLDVVSLTLFLQSPDVGNNMLEITFWS